MLSPGDSLSERELVNKDIVFVLDTSGFDEGSSPSQAGAVLEAEASPWHDQPYSVTVRVAALATLYLAPLAN